jgi:hypothetical protein
MASSRFSRSVPNKVGPTRSLPPDTANSYLRTSCRTCRAELFVSSITLRTFPPPTQFLPCRTRNPVRPLCMFRVLQKSPPLPSTHSSTPQTTFTARRLILHTSKRTQVVHESLLYTPPVPRTPLCMKPLSHQNPTSMTTTTLSSLLQTMPLSSPGAVWRPFRAFTASDSTNRTFPIILLPELSHLVYQPS